MIDSTQGMTAARPPVKYVQHDIALHSTLLNGTHAVRHEKQERIVPASPGVEKSHTSVGQSIDVYA